MALVKCKECGNQVSTDAKACPSCGAKPPKKTSMLTWIIAGFFAVSIAVSMSGGTGNGNKSLPPTPQVPQQNITSVSAPTPAAKPLTRLEEMAKRKPEDQRKVLAEELLDRVKTQNLHLNHMSHRIRKAKGGYEIMIIHDLFTKYTLSAGGTDGVFQRFMREYAAELKQANVVKVGVWGTGEYSSGSWYDLTK